VGQKDQKEHLTRQESDTNLGNSLYQGGKKGEKEKRGKELKKGDAELVFNDQSWCWKRKRTSNLAPLFTWGQPQREKRQQSTVLPEGVFGERNCKKQGKRIWLGEDIKSGDYAVSDRKKGKKVDHTETAWSEEKRLG